MDPFQIGTIMATVGMSSGILSALFLGPVLRRYGPNRVFKVGLYSFFITYTALPVANMFARRAGGIDWRVIATIMVQFSAGFMFSPCYGTPLVLHPPEGVDINPPPFSSVYGHPRRPERSKQAVAWSSQWSSPDDHLR